MFKIDNNEIVDGDGNRANKTIVNSFNWSKNNKFKNLTYMSNIRAIKKPIFLTFNAKITINHL